MKDSFFTLNKYLVGCGQQKKFPGAVLWLGNDKKTSFFEAYGYSQIIPKKKRMRKDTIFDLASITKPVCTAMSIMLLYQEKELKLTDRIEKYLKEFKNKQNGEKTIKELLIHTSGIPAWFPLYILPADKRIEYLANANTDKKSVCYSCLGYIILGKIIENITGFGLAQYSHNKIFKKLNLKYTMFKPPKNLNNIAASELGNEYEKKKAAQYENIFQVNWRNYLIKGEVHDGNCFYAFNGVSGNAGLFSNVEELAKLVRGYLAGRIVKPETVKMMIKDYTKDPEQRGLGWLINPYPGILSSESFGHTGFTGTLFVVDPKLNLIIIFLANSVHPKVKLGIMPEIRKKIVQMCTNLDARL